MSSMIANKIITKMFLVSIKLFIVRTIYVCHCFHLIRIRCIRWTIIARSIIILCLQYFYKQQHMFVILLTQLFAVLPTTEIFKPRLFSSHATRLHTRLIELLLLVVCFVLPVYNPKQTVYRTLLMYNVCALAFSRALSQLHCCLCIVYTLFIVGLLVTSSPHLSV